MKIYEMTATFGKLNHETLTLKPGLNIIEAPNEWGKSTWCAFLAAMLYGLDTRAKTTRTTIADKEHYAPWSGQPMSGRIRLSWNGRDITIERSTKGRVPLGEFAAFETDTGIAVPQLNGENCGEMLLGVEQSVFRRAGFVRLSDLPVTRDDALCRRLNALVTTGDESGDEERLARELKNLKNKCRYNRSGLLPQAEEQLSQIQKDLLEVQQLQMQSEALAEKRKNQNLEIQKLRNHMDHLRNQEASADADRVREAEQQWEEAQKKFEELQEACRKLPPREQLQKRLDRLQDLSGKMDAVMEEERTGVKQTSPPAVPPAFTGIAASDVLEAARRDQILYEHLQLNFTIVWILVAVCAGAGAVLCFALQKIGLGIICIAGAVGLLASGFLCQSLQKEKLKALTEKYGDDNSDHWLSSAQRYQKDLEDYQRGAFGGRRVLSNRLEELKKQQAMLCGENTVVEAVGKLQKLLAYGDMLSQAEKDADQARKHVEDLKSMAKKAEMPQQEDELFLTKEETTLQLEDLQTQNQKLLSQIGQDHGRMEALGTEARLQQQKRELEERIQNLETYYEALTIALAKLEEAAAELQRKFSPRITRRAQELMSRMTGGRYDRLILDEDFSLKTSAEMENVLHSALWRSEGTMDQLYLALRLAVSEALSPEAPLVLDDALVRFDSRRLQKTLEILAEEEKQVILFTCQDRERKIFPQAAVIKS